MAKKRQALALLEPILIDTFGLERLVPPQPILSEWLDAVGTIEPENQIIINKIVANIIANGDSWNEEELKMKFISHVIYMAEFNTPINTYYDREISAMIGDVFMSCKSDMMLSKGTGGLIKTPYFFLHEYKREKKYSGDPIGQMLGAMLIAQANNNNGKPLYGCYVQGRFWFFSVLIGKQYVISNSFNASEITHLHQIIFILRKLKQIILEQLMV